MDRETLSELVEQVLNKYERRERRERRDNYIEQDKQMMIDLKRNHNELLKSDLANQYKYFAKAIAEANGDDAAKFLKRIITLQVEVQHPPL